MWARIIVIAITVFMASPPLCNILQSATLDSSKNRISNFNKLVDQAVSTGETWPCSPMMLTYEFYGFKSSDIIKGRDLLCRKTISDTSASVTVRGATSTETQDVKWLKIQFHKLDDNTWRMMDINPAAMTAEKPHGFQSKNSIGISLPEGAKRIERSDVLYFAETHSEITYTETFQNIEVTITGAKTFPFMAMQPDSTIPIAVSYGPSPFSVPQPLFVVLTESAFKLILIGGGLADNSSVSFNNVVPGPYRFQIARPALGGTRVQLWCKKKLIREFAFVN